ncbi:hypothetical protein OUZ56_022691 [Daphnia magna]|uniref:Uncharacterized protein n=1 Tax=Daphnia magna TaxID=35525 RepID=A0ABR0AX71_9CRUS|nr:hypothetical protein OUZ56_022691 [Daphnia magna]
MSTADILVIMKCLDLLTICVENYLKAAHLGSHEGAGRKTFTKKLKPVPALSFVSLRRTHEVDHIKSRSSSSSQPPKSDRFFSSFSLVLKIMILKYKLFEK